MIGFDFDDDKMSGEVCLPNNVREELPVRMDDLFDDDVVEEGFMGMRFSEKEIASDLLTGIAGLLTLTDLEIRTPKLAEMTQKSTRVAYRKSVKVGVSSEANGIFQPPFVDSPVNFTEPLYTPRNTEGDKEKNPNGILVKEGDTNLLSFMGYLDGVGCDYRDVLEASNDWFANIPKHISGDTNAVRCVSMAVVGAINAFGGTEKRGYRTYLGEHANTMSARENEHVKPFAKWLLVDNCGYLVDMADLLRQVIVGVKAMKDVKERNKYLRIMVDKYNKPTKDGYLNEGLRHLPYDRKISN